MPRIRVAAAQLNLVVGDLDGNEARLLEAYDRAAAVDADLVAFPELAVTGYPPEDLLLRPAFVAHAAESVAKIAARTGTAAAVIGYPELLADGGSGQRRRTLRQRRGAGRLPQAPAAQLRGLRRAAVLRAVRGRRTAVHRRRPAGRTHDLRGRVELRRSGRHPGRRGGGGRGEHQRVAVLRGPRARARGDAGRAGAPRRGADRLREPRGRAGRAGLRRRVDGHRRRRHGPGPRAAVRGGPPRRRPRCPARPPPARPGRSRPARAAPHRRGQREPPRAAVPSTTRRAAPRPGAGGLPGVGARHARLRAEERVRARGPGAVGRRRLVARRRHRRGRARPRPGHRCAHAVALLERGSITDAEALAAEPRHRHADDPHRARARGVHDDARRLLRRVRAGPRRGESPGPGTRHDRDDALEQVRVVGAHHREQERDGHGLLDALRRHGGRVRGHQGRAQDARVRAVRGPQPAAGREVVPRAVIEKPPSAELRPDQSDEDSLPPYAVLDQILEGYVEDDRSIADLVAAGFDRDTVSRAWPRSSTAPSTSAARPRPAPGCRRRRSARTGACRSPTAGPVRWPGGCARTCRSSPSRWRPRLYGSTFILVQDALDDVTPSAFNVLRFGVAVARAPAARRARRDWRGPAPRDHGLGPHPRGRAAPHWAWSGIVAYQTQNVGLHHTSTSNSSFITGLFVVFTPLIAALRYRRAAAPVRWSGRSSCALRRPVPADGCVVPRCRSATASRSSPRSRGRSG